MHELLALRLWAFTMLGMLALAISVPGQTPPCDANSQARAALALAQTPPPTGSAQKGTPTSNSTGIERNRTATTSKNNFKQDAKKTSKCDCGCDRGQECSCAHCIAGHWMGYSAGYKLALETGRPLIVFVGMTVYDYSQIGICCKGNPADFPYFSGVIVSRPVGGYLERLADLKYQENLYVGVSPRQIRRVLSGEQPPAPPTQKTGTRPSVQRRGGSGRSC